MLTYKDVPKVTKVITSVTCDVCGKTYVWNWRDSDDVFETQEFLHINLKGGYGSVFGDGSTIKCDICQHCLKKLLGKYLRVDEEG